MIEKLLEEISQQLFEIKLKEGEIKVIESFSIAYGRLGVNSDEDLKEEEEALKGLKRRYNQLTIELTEFNNDSTIELGILLFDDTIKSILKGDNSLSLFSVKRKDRFLIELEKQELNKPKYPTLFTTHKMKLNYVTKLKKCKFNDIYFCYYKKDNKRFELLHQGKYGKGTIASTN